MPAHSVSTYGTRSFHGQGVGVPMPPPSVSKGDEETGSITNKSEYVNQIEVDGQTKISALDDPTLVSADIRRASSIEQDREIYESKARVWNSLWRKACLSLLCLAGLIAGVVILMESAAEHHDVSTTTASQSNADNDFVSSAWEENTDDFFDSLHGQPDGNGRGCRENNNGDNMGMNDNNNNQTEPLLQERGGGGRGGGGGRKKDRCRGRGRGDRQGDGRGGGGNGGRGNSRTLISFD